MRYLILLLALSACASNPNKAEKLDTSISHSRDVSSGQVLGVKNGNMVVQKKVLMNEELRRIQIESYDLESTVYGGNKYWGRRGLYGVLEECYLKLEKPMAERREYVIPDEDYTQVGLDDGNSIIGVEEEYLKDRITRFKTYKKVLSDREYEYGTKIKQCHINVAKENI